MPIAFDKATNAITLSTVSSTYQMQVDRFGNLLHLYYGRRTEGCMDYLLTYADRGFSPSPYDAADDRTYSLDALPLEYPCEGVGDFRSPVLSVRDGRGAFGCDLRYRGHEVVDGKYGLPGLPAAYGADESDGAQTLRIMLSDERLGLEVTLLYGVLPKIDVITRAAILQNVGGQTLAIEKAQSACLDFVSGDFDVLSFNGRHAKERTLRRSAVDHVSQVVSSRRGMSSHQYNPMMILCDTDATETSGRCWSMSLVYSGDFKGEVERGQYDQTRMQLGLSDERFSYPLAPGESLVAPEVIMTFSNDGLDRLSQNLHECIARHVCRGEYRDVPRPVVINSWEATYFDFTGADILSLARSAADLGIDMLVLDDGWFGARDDDSRALGDWRVNEAKLGSSLAEFVGRINALGLRFGLWFEPEMVNENSDLYREHPDWALAIPGKPPVLGRSQLVLDFSRADVRENVFEQVCSVLDQANVEYLKWDFNRSIADVYSATAKGQGAVLYDYVLGLYDFLERLIARYPHLLIEGCSGGGGRFDAGMLYYAPQIWCSDNTDAYERLSIQYGTSFGYPASAVCAHVSACPNELNGRVTPLETRAAVALAAGGFGYELDLRKLSEAERDEVREQVRLHREIDALVRQGRCHRLSDPLAEPVAAWSFVSADGASALVEAVVPLAEANAPTRCVRLRDLTPGSLYRDRSSGAVYPADALMDAGLPLPLEPGDYRSYVIRLERVK
ncbi:MAG: alpha-galactosidase [Atopobiaceae bacterium]|jgi:alpha-galactosidase|nr:alpha-galactosidase [Atopobiaceae bacterium]